MSVQTQPKIVKPKKTTVEVEAVSITTAGTMLDCHRNSIARLIQRGILVPVTIGRMRRIPVAQIRDLVASPPPRVRVTGRRKVVTS